MGGKIWCFFRLPLCERFEEEGLAVDGATAVLERLALALVCLPAPTRPSDTQ